jgi:hypothetical protein
MSRHLIDVSLPPEPPGPDSSHSPVDPDFAGALARCALTWHQQPDEAAALAAITADTPRLLRGADAAAVVTVSRSGILHIQANTGPIQGLRAALVPTVAPHQWTLRPPPPVSPGLAVGRWPAAATLDHHAQMGSMICAPLGSGTMMFGTLLVLGLAADAFTPATAAEATTVAIHASLALAAHRQHRHWQDAVTSRDIIGQAKGILMHQRQLTAAQAFTELLHASQRSNIKVRQIAETLCLTGELIDPIARPMH